jgi:Tify domain binding domain
MRSSLQLCIHMTHPFCADAGTVSDRGMIACSCTKCVKSSIQHSSSEWEVHAGSRERRPAESIFLTKHKFSLRVCTPRAVCALSMHLMVTAVHLPCS